MGSEAGVAWEHRASGAAATDFDGDGWTDLYVTSHGPPGVPAPGHQRLYRNRGDGTFEEVAAAAGVAIVSTTSGDGFGAAFGDIDLDGDLDLFVSGWQFESFGNRLFRNNGDGTFTDVTNSAGIAADGVRGFAPCLADMTGDRYPEILIAADFGTSSYFINQDSGQSWWPMKCASSGPMAQSPSWRTSAPIRHSPLRRVEDRPGRALHYTYLIDGSAMFLHFHELGGAYDSRRSSSSDRPVACSKI